MSANACSEQKGGNAISEMWNKKWMPTGINPLPTQDSPLVVPTPPQFAKAIVPTFFPFVPKVGGRKLTPAEKDYYSKNMPDLGPLFKFDLDGDFEERTGNFFTNIPGDIARGFQDAKKEYNKDTLGINSAIGKIPVAGELINKWSGSGIVNAPLGVLKSGRGSEQKGQQGDGLFDWLAPSSMSPKVKAFSDQYGNWVIESIQICRVPIVRAIDGFIKALDWVRNIASLGFIKRKYNYDALMHLYMVITLTNNEVSVANAALAKAKKSIRIERNQVMQISDAIPGDTQNVGKRMCISARVPPNTTFNVAIGRFVDVATKRNPTMGPWRYAALPTKGVPSNNCQNFVIDFITGLGTLTHEIQNFVLQSVVDLVPGLFQRFGQTVTDLAGSATQLIGGGEIDPRLLEGDPEAENGFLA